MLTDVAIQPPERVVREASDSPFSPKLYVPGNPSVYVVWKSVFDRTLALALLILAAPFILLAGCLVKLTSRGPMFYTQVRVGRHDREFHILKIRTMQHNCEHVSGVRWAVPNDLRITAIGQLLRRLHLDELPQLWNVVIGDMSLIGPRPERPEFVPKLKDAIPGYGHRLSIKPGMTGLAQVQLPPDTDLDSVRRKLTLDLYYIQQRSFWLDLRILLATALYVLQVPAPTACRLSRVPSLVMVERSTP